MGEGTWLGPVNEATSVAVRKNPVTGQGGGVVRGMARGYQLVRFSVLGTSPMQALFFPV